MDPIAELMSDLHETGKPSLAWIVRWSHAGEDPIAAAIKATQEPTMLREFILGLAQKGLVDKTAKDIALADFGVYSNAKAVLVNRQVDMESGSYIFRFEMRRKGKTFRADVTVSALSCQSSNGHQVMLKAQRLADGRLREQALQPERLAALRAAMPMPPTLADLLARRP